MSSRVDTKANTGRNEAGMRGSKLTIEELERRAALPMPKSRDNPALYQQIWMAKCALGMTRFKDQVSQSKLIRDRKKEQESFLT